MSIFRALSASAALVVATAAFAQPANDNCAAAQAATLGTAYAFDTTLATNDGTSSCGAGQNDIWYSVTVGGPGSITATTCGSAFDTVVSIVNGCGGTEIACVDDACGLQTTVSGSVAAAGTYLVRVAGFAGARGTGTVTITFAADLPVDWTEQGDAGDLPATAQVPVGTGALNTIRGACAAEAADMYKITICDFANFSATTVSPTTGTQDTQLFLFNSAGVGVQMDDDSPNGGTLNSLMHNEFVTANGDYYIAISHYDTDPLNASGFEIWADTPYTVVRAPDGALAGGDFVPTGWNGSSSFSYQITMTGACFPGAGCAADFNNDGVLDFFDYLDFVDAFSNNNPSADFNHDGVIDFFDYLDFVDAFSHGC